MCLGWKPEDFDRYTLKDLLNICEGQRLVERERWEMVRWQSFWTAALPNKKGGFKFDDIKLPFDKPKEPEAIGKMKILTADEIRERYRKSGLIISENKLKELTNDNH